MVYLVASYSEIFQFFSISPLPPPQGKGLEMPLSFTYSKKNERSGSWHIYKDEGGNWGAEHHITTPDN